MADIDYTIEPDAVTFRRLVRALNQEADGRELKRDLLANLRRAVEPAVLQAQGSILSYEPTSPSAGRLATRQRASMRAAIAAGIESHAVLGGRWAGVSIVSHRVRLRSFWHAPKRFNRKVGWDHPVFGRKPDVHQVGKPGWFDVPIRSNRRVYIVAIGAAVDGAVARLSRRASG